jgi:hypothetical protein
MLLLTSVSDLLQVVTGSTGAVEVHASWVDNLNGTITPGRTNTASISTATTTTVVAAPAASTQRNVKFLSVRNDHASTSNLVDVQHTDGTNVETLWRGTLLAQESVNFGDDNGWQYLDANGAIKTAAAKLDTWLQVTADSVHATAATFADITGLGGVAVKSGKKYMFEAHLYHVNDATTTGAQYTIGGVATTFTRFGAILTVTGSATAAVVAGGSAAAINTAVIVATTGSLTNIVMTVFSGMFQPSADGTFAIRATSEVTVAAGLTIKQGSWAHIRELDN